MTVSVNRIFYQHCCICVLSVYLRPRMTTVQSKQKCSAGEFEVYLICIIINMAINSYTTISSRMLFSHKKSHSQK